MLSYPGLNEFIVLYCLFVADGNFHNLGFSLPNLSPTEVAYLRYDHVDSLGDYVIRGV